MKKIEFKSSSKVSDKVREDLIKAGYNEKEIALIADFGARIRKLRREHYLSQKELATELGVVTSSVGKYEGMPDSYPSMGVLLKLAKIFNVSVDYLLRGVEPTSVANNISGELYKSPIVQANAGDVTLINKKLTPEVAKLLESRDIIMLMKEYDKLNDFDRLAVIKYVMDLRSAKRHETISSL